ncbi:MAG: peptide deformylase [Chloroflexota bacterium]|nr:peptide deformylase [Chloroflexota bacterium]
MAVLPIVTYPDPVLRRKAKRVSRVDESLNRLIDDMIETMYHVNGAGLAAPQVGISLKIAVIGLPDEEPIVLVNPEIVKRTAEYEVIEGCLSVPGYRGKIKRSEKVTAKALDRNGKQFRIKGEGLLAEALEHEIDHLNGILYIDHIESTDDLEKLGADDTSLEI